MPEANNKERIELVTNQLINATNTINNLPNYLNTSDATANVSDLLNGQTAYVNGIKITGTMNNFGDVIIDPTTSDQIYNGGYYNSININAVTANIDPNITANNIANGINILGIMGTFEGGTNTMDATATADDIAFGLTAYANNTKITGNVPVVTNGYQIDSLDRDAYFKFNTYDHYVNINIMTPSTQLLRSGANIGVRTTKQTLCNVLNIRSSDVAVNVNIPILGINGTFTADANALSNQILENYTAYVNGVKLTGNYVPVIDETEYAECLELTNTILA